MKKMLLDFRMIKTRKQVQEYLADSLDFSHYYGKNLDSLYDMLTDINEDICLEVLIPEKSEFFGPKEEEGNEKKDVIPEKDQLYEYLLEIKKVLQDAERDNPCIHIQYRKSEK